MQSTWLFLRWACHFLQGVGFIRSGCPRPWGLATERRGWTARLGSHTLSGPAPGPRGQLRHRAESTSQACGETLQQQDAACHPQPPARRCPLCPEPAGSIPSLGHLLETTHQQKPPPPPTGHRGVPSRPLRKALSSFSVILFCDLICVYFLPQPPWGLTASPLHLPSAEPPEGGKYLLNEDWIPKWKTLCDQTPEFESQPGC